MVNARADWFEATQRKFVLYLMRRDASSEIASLLIFFLLLSLSMRCAFNWLLSFLLVEVLRRQFSLKQVITPEITGNGGW